MSESSLTNVEPLSGDSDLRRSFSPPRTQTKTVDGFITQLHHVLNDHQLYRQLVHSESSDAQALLDTFQSLLDTPDLDAQLRRSLIIATRRLSERSKLYPVCYTLKDITQIDTDPVAAGGFGDIYKAEFEGQTVCLKVIHLYQNTEKEFLLKRFSKEVILWSQLSHPNILPMYGLYRFRNGLCFVAPWMDNGEISVYLKQNPMVDRLFMCSEITQGLKYLHEESIVHGDLKSSNILIDRTGRVRISDFGISFVLDSDIVAWTTQSVESSKGGSSRWQAPELLTTGENDEVVTCTTPSDIYALGCVFYEIFVGNVPFYNISRDATVISKVQSGMRPPKPLESDLPWQNWGLTESIWILIEDCWKENPSQRPTAEQVLLRLPSIPSHQNESSRRGSMLSTVHFRRRMNKPLDETSKSISKKLLDDLVQSTMQTSSSHMSLTSKISGSPHQDRHDVWIPRYHTGKREDEERKVEEEADKKAKEEDRKFKEENRKSKEEDRKAREEAERHQMEEEWTHGAEAEKQRLRLEEEVAVQANIETENVAAAAPAESAPELATKEASHLSPAELPKKPRHGALNSDASISNGKLPATLPSALSMAKSITDFNGVSYPAGIQSPNRDSHDGLLRYDRSFLLQFMEVCKQKPEGLTDLIIMGLEPNSSHTQENFAMARGGSISKPPSPSCRQQFPNGKPARSPSQVSSSPCRAPHPHPGGHPMPSQIQPVPVPGSPGCYYPRDQHRGTVSAIQAGRSPTFTFGSIDDDFAPISSSSADAYVFPPRSAWSHSPPQSTQTPPRAHSPATPPPSHSPRPFILDQGVTLQQDLSMNDLILALLPSTTHSSASLSLNLAEDSVEMEARAKELASQCWAEGDFSAKGKIAEWLGGHDRINKLVLHHYVNFFDFAGLRLDMAFRRLCFKLCLKAETQQVDRILQEFSCRYWECNPGGIYGSANIVHSVASSLFLLNTDLHVADLTTRMSCSQFVRNTVTAIKSTHSTNLSNSDPTHSSKRSDSLTSSNSLSKEVAMIPFQTEANGSTQSVQVSNVHEPRTNPNPAHGQGWEADIESLLEEMYNAIKSQQILQPLSSSNIQSPASSNNGGVVVGNLDLRSQPDILTTLKRGSIRGLRVTRGASPYSSNSSLDGRVSPSSSFATSTHEVIYNSSSSFLTPALGFVSYLSHTITRKAQEDDDQSIHSDASDVTTISISDEELALLGAPWAKEGILCRKQYWVSTGKRARDKSWMDVFVVIQKGELNMFTFGDHSSGATGTFGGGNWLANAQSVGQLHLAHSLAHSLPPPGYNRQRPYCMVLTMANDGVYFFQAGTEELVNEWVSTCNYWAARTSKEPLAEGVSNMEYGWNRVIDTLPTGRSQPETGSVQDHTDAMSVKSGRSTRSKFGGWRDGSTIIRAMHLPWAEKTMINDWKAPLPPIVFSVHDEETQLEALRKHVLSMKKYLDKHNDLREPMTALYQPRTPNANKAQSNWEKKSQWLLTEVVKYESYIDSLQVAMSLRLRKRGEKDHETERLRTHPVVMKGMWKGPGDTIGEEAEPLAPEHSQRFDTQLH
ncbi:hypothetical protein C0989_002325 [Termitomyces sp. Mn162]|nr:hypothetical protein C0989_002325 [Termitomyces sp. Mn162]